MAERKCTRAVSGLLVSVLSGCVGLRTPIDDAGVGDVAVVPLGCFSGAVQLVQARPMAMFLIDRSGSMSTPIDSTISGETRWEALTGALASALAPVDESLAVGAVIFPSAPAPGSSGCPVAGKADLVPATGNVGALIKAMVATAPNGSTPTAAALAIAADTILSMHAPADRDRSDRTIMITEIGDVIT